MPSSELDYADCEVCLNETHLRKMPFDSWVEMEEQELVNPDQFLDGSYAAGAEHLPDGMFCAYVERDSALLIRLNLLRGIARLHAGCPEELCRFVRRSIHTVEIAYRGSGSDALRTCKSIAVRAPVNVASSRRSRYHRSSR